MNKENKELLDDLKLKLPIDQFNLELECRNQSVLLTEMGEIASVVKSEFRSAKEHLEYVKAKLSTDIRAEPSKYNLSKTTADSVSAAVILQPGYRDASKAMIDAEEASNVFSTLLQAVEGRKSLIRDIVSLFLHQYYDNQQLTGEQGSLNKVTEDQIINQRARKIESKETVTGEIND